MRQPPTAGSLRRRPHSIEVGSPAARVPRASGPPRGGAPLHVLEVFQPATGGVPAYVAALAPGLLAAGVRVSVAGPPGAAFTERLRGLGIEVLELPVVRSPHPLQDAQAVHRLARWCRRRHVSLVHGHSTKAGLLAALAASRAGVPSLYTPHGWAFERHDPKPLRLGYALFERSLVRHYHAGVVTVSSSGRRLAERWRVAPRGRVQVVSTGIPAMPLPARAAARSRLGLAEHELVAAWIGRAGAQKQPEHLARIARRLRGEVTVVAACEGAHGTALEHELRSAGVRLVQPTSEPATLYAAADMLLQTSAWEAAPLAVLEAMGCALPVVAYDVGGLGELVAGGRTGYLVAPGDVEMMCACAESLGRRPGLRTQMGEAGRRRAQRHFSYPAMVGELVRAYERLAGSSAVLCGSSVRREPGLAASAAPRWGATDRAVARRTLA